MFITLVHLACEVLTRLVALDEGDGLLNFKTLFQPVVQEYQGSNAPLIIAVVLCGGVLEFLIRHTIIRVLGTCLVVACLDGRNQHAADSEAPRRHKEGGVWSINAFSLLRRTKLLRARVRRSITYAFAYSIAAGLCSSLASSISESYLWLAFAEVATVVVLERIHFRWTHAILSRTSRPTPSYPWRDLLLPTILYALARKVVAELPAAIGTSFIAEGISPVDAVATRDVVVLASAFMLRFFILYPAWASLISFETRRTTQTHNPEKRDHTYVHTLKQCYQKVLLRLAGLHLQAAGIMIGIELVVYIVLHFLLHTPPSTILD